MPTERGEQIVRLASALLEAHRAGDTFPFRKTGTKPSAKRALRFSARLLCLTAILSSFGTGFAMQVYADYTRPANRYEQTEIDALFFYAEQTRGLPQPALRQSLGKRLGILSWNDLSARDCARVREALRDYLTP